MPNPIDVAEIIDQQRIGWFQLRIIVLCGLVQFLDGFDTQAIAYVGPTLTRAWHLDRGALGPVFGAGILGILLGSLLIGPLADWLGRKKLMIVALVIISAFSLLTARSGSLRQLLAFRFLTGLGLGGVIPSTVVITNEYAPRHRRATMVTLMACGFAVGAASGGLVTALLLPFGWPAIFYVGGLVPLALALALVVWLPESLRLLVLKRADRSKISRLLLSVNPKLALPDDVEFAVRPETHQALPVFELFRDGRVGITTLLWLAFFMNLLALNFLNNWLPTVINSSGLPVQEAVRITTLFQFGGMVGVISMGALVDRYGYYPVLGTAFLFAALFTGLIGSVGSSARAIAALISGAGFCIIGVQMTLAALSATLYPTAIRSTGTSWAFGIGRLGSFSGPVLGGVLLSLGWSLQILFCVAAIPAVCGTGAILLMAAKKSRSLEPSPRASSWD